MAEVMYSNHNWFPGISARTDSIYFLTLKKRFKLF